MKLFVAEDKPKSYLSETNYHWCDADEILMFGQFQSEEGDNPSEVSMCGIKSRKFTTNIIVKVLDLSEQFLLELITESVENSMKCKINEDGSFNVDFGEGCEMPFNIRDILKELVDKASEFSDGDKVVCCGRKITIFHE